MIRINWVLVFVIGATCTGQGAMPGEPNTTTFLNICSILERGNPRLVVDYNRIGAAMDLALKVVNEEILPPEVQLRKLYKDGGKACSPKNLAISHIIEWAHENVYCNIFIGPGCTHAVLDMYQAAESLKIPLIAAPGAFVSGLSGVPRNGFPNMIRTTYTFVDLGKCLLKFMNLFNYTHNSVIVDVADPFFSEMGESFRIQYKAEPLITRKNTTFLDLTVEFRTQAEYRRHLDSLLSQANRVSRVIMIFANSTIIRDLLIIANHKGMTQGQHVYMGVEMYKSRIWGTYTWQFNDFGDMSARTAYQSLIIASMAEVNGPQMDEFARMLRKLALKKYNYTFGAFERVDPVVMAYYDAVTLYGTAINTLINGGATQNITDLNSLIKSMRNITIPSNLQANIDIGANGDRMVLYEIKHFPQDVSTGTAISASPFLRLDFVNNEFTSLGVLSWPQPDGSFGTQLPPNSPPCGFLNSECKEEQMNYSGLVSAAIIIPLLLIISGTVAGFVFYRRLNYVRDPYWWRYFVNDLEFTSTASGPRSHSAKSMQSKVSSIKQSETVYIISTWKTAFLHGSMVSINPVPDRTYHPTAPLLQDLERLRLLRHQNLQRFIGLCIEESTHNGWILYIIGECCTKGCLQDILNKKKMKLDWSFRFSFIKDIVEGIWYLHSTSVQSHGYLTSKTILIDGRFVVKLSEFGLAKLQNPQEREAFLWMDENCDDEVVQSLLWRAPELLKIKMPENGTQKGDIYSFAIVLQQIILRTDPYIASEQDLEEYSISRAQEILTEVAKGQPPLLRPPVTRSACSVELYDLLEQCWSEVPIDRPSATRVRETVRKISGIKNDNIIDLIISRMEQYSTELESQLAEKTDNLQTEKLRQESILKQMLPSGISQALLQGLTIKPKFFPFATVLCAKITGLETNGPAQIDDVLNALAELMFSWDAVIRGYYCMCIPSAADALKIVDDRRTPESEWAHVKTCAAVAFDLMDVVRQICASYNSVKNQLTFKCGMDTGKCLLLVANVTGEPIPRCFLIGLSVSTAEYLLYVCEANHIHVSEASKNTLCDDFDVSQYIISERMPAKTEQNTACFELPKTYWIRKAES